MTVDDPLMYSALPFKNLELPFKKPLARMLSISSVVMGVEEEEEEEVGLPPGLTDACVAARS